MGFFDKGGFGRLKESLNKTRNQIVGKVTRLVAAKSTIDDDVLDQLEEILITADIGVDTTVALVESIRDRVQKDKYIDSAELNHMLHDEIQRQFEVGNGSATAEPFRTGNVPPYVVMVVGINGVGKTTTIGKLAYRYREAGKKVAIAAADTFRAAANEQLEIWAQRAGADLIQHAQGSDPAAVAFDAVRSAAVRNTDVVIIDTAGRLHTKINLMEELKKIRRVVAKQLPDAPHEVLLVLDASTGQNGLQQAKQFTAAAGVTGLVLTKVDGTAKGGIVFAIGKELHLPVQYIGVGEQLEDLQPFDARAFVEALFTQEQ